MTPSIGLDERLTVPACSVRNAKTAFGRLATQRAAPSQARPTPAPTRQQGKPKLSRASAVVGAMGGFG